MPTPVIIARQCLAPEAIEVLDEAVSVAHRRYHIHTSSLHAVSALLSTPSSPLREACARARNSAYASGIKFKVLEFCLGVALDRLSSTSRRVEEPPVSNSLMAAIKRSQANQRRQPGNFHLYQQTAACSTSSTSVSTVKVELQNLILSILDDPAVSRVFGDSGFRSSDIKLFILRPVHHQLRRYKGQPFFLCNLTNNISFPFQGFLENNEIHRRINEILVRKHGNNRNNLLLVGPSAIDTVRTFLETLQKTKTGASSIFTPELSTVISVKQEILNFISGKSDVTLLKIKLEEVGNVLEQSIGSGVIVEYGDLKDLPSENLSDAVSVVVKKLSGLVADHGGRVRLIGSAESHETCMQFFKIFPSVEEEWNLHLLPIDSMRHAMVETLPKSSLMESFVPFGGFFSMPSDIKIPLKISNHFGSLCHICDVKFKEEVNAISKGENDSVSYHSKSALPSWLQRSQICASSKIGVMQPQDDTAIASVKIIGLQKKWHNICQSLHQHEPYFQMLPKVTYSVESCAPSVVDFQVTESTNQIAGSSIGSGCITIPKLDSRNSIDSLTVCSLSGSRASRNSMTTDLGLGPFDQKDSKLVYSSLFTRVDRQEEALGVISQTIAHCRAQPAPYRGGIWFGFVGPDRAAKKKTAIALAEVLFGGRENMICVDVSCQDFINGCDLKSRGKTIIDFIAGELIKKQLSIVFLENVDRADMMTQHHLFRAASTGRFSDSHGREVSISNAIFVLTSKFFGENELEGEVDYTEENIVKAKCGSIRLLTGFDLSGMKPGGKSIHVTRNRKPGSPVCKNKRKHYLDLNLPAEEDGTGYHSATENPNEWLEDLLEHVTKKVIFKPFDFDTLAEKILKQICDCFKNHVELDCLLEIDYEVMELILKASYFLGTMKTENWIEHAFGEAFTKAQKYDLGSHSVLKLITAELPEEPVSGVLLPERIMMT